MNSISDQPPADESQDNIHQTSEDVEEVHQPSEEFEEVHQPSVEIEEVHQPSEEVEEVLQPSEDIEEVRQPSEVIEEVLEADSNTPTQEEIIPTADTLEVRQVDINPPSVALVKKQKKRSVEKKASRVQTFRREMQDKKDLNQIAKLQLLNERARIKRWDNLFNGLPGLIWGAMLFLSILSLKTSALPTSGTQVQEIPLTSLISSPDTNGQFTVYSLDSLVIQNYKYGLREVELEIKSRIESACLAIPELHQACQANPANCQSTEMNITGYEKIEFNYTNANNKIEQNSNQLDKIDSSLQSLNSSTKSFQDGIKLEQRNNSDAIKKLTASQENSTNSLNRSMQTLSENIYDSEKCLKNDLNSQVKQSHIFLKETTDSLNQSVQLLSEKISESENNLKENLTYQIDNSNNAINLKVNKLEEYTKLLEIKPIRNDPSSDQRSQVTHFNTVLNSQVNPYPAPSDSDQVNHQNHKDNMNSISDQPPADESQDNIHQTSEDVEEVHQPSEEFEEVHQTSVEIEEVHQPSEEVEEVHQPSEDIEEVRQPSEVIEDIEPRTTTRTNEVSLIDKFKWPIIGAGITLVTLATLISSVIKIKQRSNGKISVKTENNSSPNLQVSNSSQHLEMANPSAPAFNPSFQEQKEKPSLITIQEGIDAIKANRSDKRTPENDRDLHRYVRELERRKCTSSQGEQA